MTFTRNLYCLVGESGAGKTSIAERLEEYGYKQIQSYTTRAPRYPNEKGHIFINCKSFEEIQKQYPNRIAETTFNDNFYFATSEQVEECDIYVVDPIGVLTLKERYSGTKGIKVIYIYCSEAERHKRMKKRGDNEESIEKRLANDKVMFAGASEIADIVIWNLDVDRSVEVAIDYIQREG